MTVTLDQMIEIGSYRVMAISDCVVCANHRNGSVIVAGQKRPVAVLIRQDSALMAFGADGMPMTRDQIEKLCPGAWVKALEVD